MTQRLLAHKPPSVIRAPLIQTRPPATAALGKAVLIGSGTLTAHKLRGIVNLKASLTGKGTLTAKLKRYTLLKKANLSGTGVMSGDLTRTVKMKANLTGQGTLIVKAHKEEEPAGPPLDSRNDFTAVGGHRHINPRKARGWNR